MIDGESSAAGPRLDLVIEPARAAARRICSMLRADEHGGDVPGQRRGPLSHRIGLDLSVWSAPVEFEVTAPGEFLRAPALSSAQPSVTCSRAPAAPAVHAPLSPISGIAPKTCRAALALTSFPPRANRAPLVLRLPRAKSVPPARFELVSRPALRMLPTALSLNVRGYVARDLRWPHGAKAKLLAPEISGRISMRRHRAVSLRESEFARERRALADTARVEESEIAWIGLFRLTPLAEAQRIEVDERRGVLSLYPKPTLGAKPAHRRKRLVVDLAMGRIRSTGAIVQAVVPRRPDRA